MYLKGAAADLRAHSKTTNLIKESERRTRWLEFLKNRQQHQHNNIKFKTCLLTIVKYSKNTMKVWQK